LTRGDYVVKAKIESDRDVNAVLKIGNYKLTGVKFWLNGDPAPYSGGYQLDLQAGENELIGAFNVASGTLSYKLVGMFMSFYEPDGATPLNGVMFYDQDQATSAREWNGY